MIFANIKLGSNVQIDASSSINNIDIGDDTKIAKHVSAYGSAENILRIGKNSYIGMNCILNGYASQLSIGDHVSIAQNVNIMTDSGPNASPLLQKIFSLQKGEIEIGNHSWIGASSIIMPGVKLGRFCIVAANSFVNSSFDEFSIIGGTPAKLIRRLNEEEIEKIRK